MSEITTQTNATEAILVDLKMALCPVSGQTIEEEKLNTLTHGLGLFLSIVGFIVMATINIKSGNHWALASCGIFGLTLILLYGASTLYHGWQRPEQKHILQLLDHSCIYLLIAGSYTPFALLSLGGARGWWLFGLIWGAALIGILAKFVTPRSFVLFEVVLYLAMGWAVMPMVGPLKESLPGLSFVLLFAGGAAYSFGVIFYLFERIPYNHAIWHLFVLAGSTFHFFAVITSLSP